jgi:hypothetical protein
MGWTIRGVARKLPLPVSSAMEVTTWRPSSVGIFVGLSCEKGDVGNDPDFGW